MFIEIEGYIEYLVKHKMTPNQFLFLYLRHTLDTDILEKYIEGVRAWKREEIYELVNRGYLDNVNSEGEDNSEAFFVTPKFVQEMFVELEEAGEQLWEAYPPFFFIDGRRCAARTCDKEWLEKTYGKRIKQNRGKHEKILRLVKKLKAENKISMGIEKFVTSEQWDSYWAAEKENIVDKQTSNTSHEL